MPRIFGLNLVGVLAGSVAFYVVGWLWYGVIFEDAWMAAMGLPEMAEEPGAMTMIGGFVITVMQVIGIGLVLQWKGAGDIAAAVKTAAVLWLVFALPFSAYGYFYGPAQSGLLLAIDASHLLVGWVAAAIAIAVFK